MTAAEIKQTCERCRYWRMFPIWEYEDMKGWNVEWFHTGECKRYPPQGADEHDTRGDGYVQWHAGHKPFPFTDHDSWCGEWAKK